jgi:hypothetical protein
MSMRTGYEMWIFLYRKMYTISKVLLDGGSISVVKYFAERVAENVILQIRDHEQIIT